MGRHAIRYQITGYLIQAPGSGGTYNGMDHDYDVARDRLENALMSPQPGNLSDPYNPRFFAPNNPTGSAAIASQLAAQNSVPGMPQLSLPGYGDQPPLFICDRYSIIEQREKGGFCQVEMSFVESGLPANTQSFSPTAFVSESTFATIQQQSIDTNSTQSTFANFDPVQPTFATLDKVEPTFPSWIPQTAVPKIELPPGFIGGAVHSGGGGATGSF